MAKYNSKSGQLFEQNLAPIDAIIGPWNSISEFEDWVTNTLDVDITSLPKGTHIRVIENNVEDSNYGTGQTDTVVDYYWINGQWTNNNTTIAPILRRINDDILRLESGIDNADANANEAMAKVEQLVGLEGSNFLGIFSTMPNTNELLDGTNKTTGWCLVGDDLANLKAYKLSRPNDFVTKDPEQIGGTYDFTDYSGVKKDVEDNHAMLIKEIEIIKHGFYYEPDAPTPDEPNDTPSDSDNTSGGDGDQDEPQEQLEWVHPNNGQTASGTTVGSAIKISSFGGYGYLKIQVKAGDKFFIHGTGGTSGRFVAFTDEDDVLVLKDPNSAEEGNYTIITAPQDGYLYSTNKFDSSPNPYIRKPAYYKDKVIGRHEITNNLSYVSGTAIGNSLGNIASNGSFRCLIIPVFAGMKATIYTYGGSNGRAYQVTDLDRKIVAVAQSSENLLSVPAVIDIEQDGLLSINADNDKLPEGFNPYVIIENSNSGEGGGSGEDTPTPDVPEEPTDDNRELCLDVLNEKVEWLKRVINNGNIGTGGSSSDGTTTTGKSELKILCVGNSFADNMTGYINDLCQNLDVTKLVTIYKYNTGSSSLSNWWSRYINEVQYMAAKVCGRTIDVGTTMKQGFACDWDIVVLQQLSSKTGDYSTFEPYLTNLIANIKKLCTNPSVKIAWQMTWPRTSIWNGASAPIGVNGFDEIANAVKSMIESGVSIDYIIPSGTAIMNARGNATLNNDNELSSDGQHLASGVGMYIASCTMYQTLIKDFVGKPLTASTLSKSPNSGTGVTPVDDTNRELCHMAALYACSSPYKICELSF